MRITEKIAKTLLGEIKALSNTELESLKDECHQLSRTNCWWLEYQCRNVFWDLADNEQKRRENNPPNNGVNPTPTAAPVGGVAVAEASTENS